jgi:hypothetical protein
MRTIFAVILVTASASALTLRHEGITYAINDPVVARQAHEHQLRLIDAQRKLVALEATQRGLNTWALKQDHAQLIPAPVTNADDRFALGNRPSASFRSPEDSRDRMALRNAARAESLKLERMLKTAVRDGGATAQP